MIRFFDYYKDSFRFALLSLQYRMIPDEGMVNFLIRDDVQVEKTDTGLAVHYTRLLSVKTEDEPVLKVAYKALFDNREKMDSSGLTSEEIHAALYDNALNALDPIAARMSILVGEIMFAGYGQPLVLPPNVVRE